MRERLFAVVTHRDFMVRQFQTSGAENLSVLERLSRLTACVLCLPRFLGCSWRVPAVELRIEGRVDGPRLFVRIGVADGAITSTAAGGTSFTSSTV